MTREFDARLSARLDLAIVKSEQGRPLWGMVKRFLEWIIFGGKL